MLRQCGKCYKKKKPDNYVIATGKQYSVRFFIERCLKFLDIKIKWSGTGLNETAKVISFDKKKYPHLNKHSIIIRISKKYFRPNEVDNLIGDSSKAKRILKWKAKITIDQLIEEMLIYDLNLAKKNINN